MAKESGLGMTCAVDDSTPTARSIENDITDISWGIPRGVQDVTGLDKSGNERLLLLADFTATLNGVFNDAANMSHVVFKTVGSSSAIRTVTIVISGQSLANECYATDYALTRGADGSFTWTVPMVLQNGTVPSWT